MEGTTYCNKCVCGYDGCEEISKPDKYCIVHICDFTDCNLEILADQYSLCYDHKCVVDGCDEVRELFSDLPLQCGITCEAHKDLPNVTMLNYMKTASISTGQAGVYTKYLYKGSRFRKLINDLLNGNNVDPRHKYVYNKWV